MKKGNWRKILRYVAAAGAVLGIVMILWGHSPRAGKADFGDFSGDYDYGGGGGWDSGSSWDSDYSWSSSGSYGSSSHSSSSSDLDGLWLCVVVVCIIVSLLPSSEGKHKSGHSSQPAGASFDDDGRPISEYRSVDPGFDRAAFESYCSNLYVRMQECWTDKNIDSLQPYFESSYFAQMKKQLDGLIRTRRTNYVERIAVLEVKPRNWYQSLEKDHMRVEVRTRITDYTLDDDTGRVVKGSKTAEKFMTYQWTMVRKSGVVTESSQKMAVIKCSHCGADVEVNTSTICPYCRSIVTAQPTVWAIENIKGISQQTVH